MDTFGRPLFCLPQIPITGEDMEKLKLSYSVGGNVNWHSHLGKHTQRLVHSTALS